MMKGYLQLAAGLGEMSRRKAMDAARDLVEGTSVAGLRSGSTAGPEALAAQVAAVADELMSIGRQNRRLLAQVVRTETEAVLASLGVRAERGTVSGGGRLDDQLRALRDRVDELERQLRGRAGGTVTSGTTKASAPRGTPRTTKKTATTARSRGAAGATKKAATAAGARRAAGATKKAAKTTAKRTAAGARSSATARGRARGATS
jgi:hypothetical protein